MTQDDDSRKHLGGVEADVTPSGVAGSNENVLRDIDGVMSVALCNTDEQEREIIQLAKARGLRLACISNAGLMRPWVRMTFLPPSAFKENPIGGPPSTDGDVKP